MTLPGVLIVADYKHLASYLVLPDSLPEILARVDFEHDCQTGAPLVEWSGERNGYQEIAEMIGEILDRYHPESWGLACPEDFGSEIVQYLSKEQQRTLTVMRMLELAAVDVANVCKIFDQEAPDYCQSKEHV
jgi:hypothetical protein